MFNRRRVYFYIFLLLIIGCNKTGIQGGDLKNKFVGISQATPISPTSVQLTWSLDDRYTSFKVYLGGSDKPLKTETFSQSIVSNLSANTQYSFTVTGVKSDGSGAEEGFQNSYSATTFASFSGIQSSMLAGTTTNSVKFKFKPQSPIVSYKLFKIIRNGTWDFSSAIDTQSSSEEVNLTASSLAGGTVYCFYVVAYYGDGTSEPKTDDLAIVNKNAVCETTSNGIPPAEVTMNPILPGAYPWFNVVGGADGNTTVEIRRLSDDALITSRRGTGELRASSPLAPGLNQFYSVTSTAFGKATNAIKFEPEPAATRAGGAYLRSIVDDVADAHGPIYPQLHNGGKGVQKLGEKVVSGDFNCDGIPDMAVSAPDSTPFGDPANPAIDPNHYTKTGAVIIYYGKRENVYDANNIKIGTTFYLNSTPIPLPTNQAPEPQLVYYTMTASGSRLGYQLAVGNVNGDCRNIRPDVNGVLSTDIKSCDELWFSADVIGTAANKNEIVSCDDLALSSLENRGAVYVLYGNPIQGFSTNAGTQTGINDFACVAGGSCQAMKYTPEGTSALEGSLSSYTSFGKSLAFGDFDNDGYDELAVGTNKSGAGSVIVLRGSSSGLYSPDRTTIPVINRSNASSNGNKVFVAEETANNFAHASVGFSLTSVPDSRKCTGPDAVTDSFRPTIPLDAGNGRLNQKNYDFTKCDDLVIGAPDIASLRGSIFSCAAKLSDTTFEIDSWYCQEHYPASAAANDQYGYSVLGIKNLNSYPIGGGSRNSYKADIAGALFVGAPGRSSNLGQVYGYYVTPNVAAVKTATQASGTGGIQMILSDVAFASAPAAANLMIISASHSIEAAQSAACNSTNTDLTYLNKWWSIDGTSTTYSACLRQSISMDPALVGARFGEALSALPDMQANDGNRFYLYSGAPLLAVSAPKARLPSVANSSVDIEEHGLVKIYQLDTSDAVAASGGAQTYPYQDATTLAYIYGGGINPFGPATVYPADLAPKSQFGKGGVVGGYFYKDPSPSLIQVIAGAGGNTVNGATSNGSLSVFKTKTKQLNFAEQKCTGVCPSGTSQLEMNYNTSIETAYHFEMAQIGGDFNGDGYADVIARSLLGDRVILAIYYGSAAGLVRTPEPSRLATGLAPLLISFKSDPSMGFKFSKVGSLNGDDFDDLLLIGSEGAYIYFGSFTGLVANVDPSTAPNGTYPLWFAKKGTGADFSLYADASGSNINGSVSSAVFETNGYNRGNEGITAGDYNGDGFADLAFGLYDTINKYHVVIIFGGASGPQVNRSTHPGIIKTTDIVEWSGAVTANITDCNFPVGGVPAGDFSKSSCYSFGTTSPSLVSGSTLKLLRIKPSVPADTHSFGKILTTLAPDKSQDTATYTNLQSSLVIVDEQALQTASNIYVFTGSGNTLKTSGAFPIITWDSGPLVFGLINVTQISSAGDINGDLIPDLLITSANDTQNSTVTSRVLYGKSASTVQFKTEALTDFTVIGFLGTASSTNNYGMGLASAGDFNQDGFGDLLINVPKGDNISASQTISQTGYVLVVFGSAAGLRTKSNSNNAIATPSVTPKCYGGPSSTGLCEPYKLYLPSSTVKEFTYISDRSVGDINGDGIPDILIGGFGRNNLYGNGYATGVVYVLY